MRFPVDVWIQMRPAGFMVIDTSLQSVPRDFNEFDWSNCIPAPFWTRTNRPHLSFPFYFLNNVFFNHILCNVKFYHGNVVIVD